jgi:hypothetical protein
MINKTIKPMLVNQDISPSELDGAIRNALQYVIRNEAEHLGSQDGSPMLRDRGYQPTFAYFFGDELSGSHVYTEEFVQAAYQISQVRNINKLTKTNLFKTPLDFPSLDLVFLKKPGMESNGKVLDPIRRGFRPFLLHLWSQQVILLPISFVVHRSLRHHNYTELLSEVAALFYNYDPTKVEKPQNHPDLRSWDDSDFDKGHRVIWTTDWHSFEEVDLHELSEFHVLTLKGVAGFPVTQWPFISMLREMVKQHGSGMKFTAEEIDCYEKWIRGGWYTQHTYEYFCSHLSEIRLDQKRRYGQRINEKYRMGLLRRNGLEATTGLDLTKPAINILLEAVAAKSDHDAALEYFTKVLGLSRGYMGTAPYPGREHIDVAALSRLWLQTFEGWLAYRRANELEEEEGFRSETRILCDYLFCYLPWWLELHPQSSIKFPYSPADFERFTFFVPTGKAVDELPVPFKEILKLRRRTVNSQGRSISQLYLYFDYVKAHVNLYPELSGQTLTNPVVLTMDYPKGSKRSSKTNKIPFSKKVMPYLLRYFYALEEFGIHLQRLAMQGELHWTLKSQPPILKPEDYGYHLKIEFNGKTYPVMEVPNVFPLARRTIKTPDGRVVSIEIPHLSALRILISGLETGLRIQAIQWLDLRTWDCKNLDQQSEEYVYDLYVNTDKTLEEPWVAPMVYRARKVLQREQEFQQSIVEEGMDRLIPYENRANSRFEDVQPLFRSSGYKGNPVDDNGYYSVWVDALLGFQGFYNTQVSREEFTQFVTMGPHWIGNVQCEGNERVDYYADGTPYCPLRYSAIHTPHSVRATFISNRSGLLDIEDIAHSVGHTDKRTTYHYTVEEYEQLVANIENVDRELWSFDPSNPVHIRADQENSALRRSLKRDRVEAEKRFGFTSVSLINEKDKNFMDGVELLRTTPMNQVVFRETHICPVGEACPKDVEDLIHEPRRCGLCPLAVKTVDHLPAIAARMRKLLEQIQNATVHLEKLMERGEPEAVLDEINWRRKLDTFEYTGWMRAFEILSDIFRNMKSDDPTIYHVDEPEIVRRHLKLVVKQTGQVEFILDRILDSNAYPSMETPELRAKANMLRQQLLANLGRVEDALQEIEAGDEITAFLSSLRAEMESFGLNLRNILEMRLLENRRGMISAGQPLLLSQATD